MKAKLTKKLVDSLKPGEAVYSVRDTEIKGFLLKVSPSGGMVYYLDYRTRDGKRKSYRIGTAGNLTPIQARDVAEKLSADVAHGKDIQLEKQNQRAETKRAKYTSLEGFLDHKYGPWVEAERKTGKETLARIKYNFRDLLKRPLVDITPWVIEKWRSEQIKTGKAKSTINRDVVALKAALSMAVAWKVIENNPLADVKPVKTDSKAKVRYLSETEEARLRKALAGRDDGKKAERESGNQWRRERGYEELPGLVGKVYADHLTPMVLLTLNTGLRRGEAFDLTWNHINFQTRTLTVEGEKAKSNQTRHIPLNDESISVLSAWRAHGKGDGLLFPGKAGARLDNVRKAWAGVLADAGIRDFRWHDSRHHFASKLVMKGVPLNTVRELLGHADLTTTLRYAHLAPDHKADAVALLG